MSLVSRRVGRTIAIATVLLACGQNAPAGQAGADNGARRTIVAARMAAGESIAHDGRLDQPVLSRPVPGGLS